QGRLALRRLPSRRRFLRHSGFYFLNLPDAKSFGYRVAAGAVFGPASPLMTSITTWLIFPSGKILINPITMTGYFPFRIIVTAVISLYAAITAWHPLMEPLARHLRL
ncbi:MAG TPA: hypothetical protein VK419_07095, partial [Bryobacteraceae bacterium]|nr:hypothetical protein [Bryobacteraceae bacterium]